jgi:mannose-1-phosphate guanylyltransferase/mannose-6-phosphate isomerase
MKRRKFLQTAGYTAAVACVSPQLSGNQSNVLETSMQPVSLEKQVSVVVKDNNVYIETQTLSAVIERGIITSFKSKTNGEEFIEKPDIRKAESYLKSGRYFWNSGIFVWRVSDILSQIKAHLPELYKGLLKIEKAMGRKDEAEVTRKVYSSLKSVSIDYGVMEKAKKVAVVPAAFGWSDLGTWRALEDISMKNQDGNVLAGNVIDIETRNSIVYAGKRLVATVGVENVVVVDTPDALLICSKDKTQDVKKVVDELKKKGAEELTIHRTVERPWGSYTVLETGERYKIKSVLINPGAKLSIQMHHHRSEHWVVVSGTARVTIGEKVYNLHPN